MLAEYHGEGDRNAPIVQLEYREMVEDISMTGSDKRWWDYRELFNSRETRYRSMLVIFMGMYHILQLITIPQLIKSHSLLRAVVRQRPRLLLLPTDAPWRRYRKQ